MAVYRDRRIMVRSVFCEIIALCLISLMYIVAAEGEVSQEQQIERSLPSDGISLVVVKAIRGNVELSSWEKPEVLVKAFKKVTADSGEEAQEHSDKVEIGIEKIEDRIEITTKQPPEIPAKVSVDYSILLPEDIALDVNVMSGWVHVTGNRSKEKITTVSGDIELRNIAGSVAAQTTSGSIYAEMFFDAESSFVTASGSINIHIGDEFSVPISAETVSGSINLTIPEGFSADVDAAIQSGSVSCELPFDGSIQEHSLRGRIFGGGPLLKLRVASGNIAMVGTRRILPTHQTEVLPEPEQEQVQVEVEEPSEEREIPYAEAIETSVPPVIDGRLDDECWRNADRIEDFVWANGIEKPHEPTEAYILWDDSNLYIGIKCYESRMDTIKISNTESDNEAWKWEDDMVQIFIDTTPDAEADYYHIAVNPIGVVFDQEIGETDTAKAKIKKFEPNVEWNSGGLFDTDMRSDFWSIEAGIPLSAMKAEPEEGDIWRFNLYRMERRRGEHTYWSPTYASEEWPHVPARFGELMFAAEGLIAETSPEQPVLPAYAGALTIADIAVEGNDKVSQEDILEALGLKPGDLAEVDVLSQAKSRLVSLGWFQDVNLDLAENDKGVDLVVKVKEKEFFSVSEVQIRGSALFTKEQIIDYFNFEPVRTIKEDVDVKCRLIEGLYKAKGYEMASADSSVVSNVLIIDIDEGHIDKIEIRGNRRVRTRDIKKALDLEPGTPYRKNEIDNAIHTMEAQLPYFRWVNWQSGRSDDGLNVVYIDVKEADLIKADLDGIGEFNRVHGLQLGLGSEVKSTYGGSRGYCKISYGFTSQIWNYQFGVEKSWFRKHRSTIGIDVHRITDTNDWELVSDTEHFIAEAILGEAWRDFYQRQGYELNFGQKLTPSNEFGLRYRDDAYTSLEKTEDWSLLDRSYAENDHYEEFKWAGSRSTYGRKRYRDEKNKPDNPPIEEGTMRSLIAEYTIDTRNSREHPTSGWLNTFSAEYAGERLDSDFDFSLYKVNIRRYNRLSGNQFLALRIKAATADRGLSPLHPRKFYLGGIGTLRGYLFKEFVGDKMLLINAEYWVMLATWLPVLSGSGVVFFVDSGYAWPYESEMNADDMKTDLGIGLQLDGLRINFAAPVEEKGKETVISFRIARMF